MGTCNLNISWEKVKEVYLPKIDKTSDQILKSYKTIFLFPLFIRFLKRVPHSTQIYAKRTAAQLIGWSLLTLTEITTCDFNLRIYYFATLDARKMLKKFIKKKMHFLDVSLNFIHYSGPCSEPYWMWSVVMFSKKSKLFQRWLNFLATGQLDSDKKKVIYCFFVFQTHPSFTMPEIVKIEAITLIVLRSINSIVQGSSRSLSSNH